MKSFRGLYLNKTNARVAGYQSRGMHKRRILEIHINAHIQYVHILSSEIAVNQHILTDQARLLIGNYIERLNINALIYKSIYNLMLNYTRYILKASVYTFSNYYLSHLLAEYPRRTSGSAIYLSTRDEVVCRDISRSSSSSANS